MGLTVNKLAVVFAVHAHPAGATRTAGNDPPPPGIDELLNVREVTQEVANWVIEYATPAIVMLPDLVPVPAATVKVTRSSPVTLAPDVIVIQVELDTAVTEHPGGTATATEPVPPAAANVCDAG